MSDDNANEESQMPSTEEEEEVIKKKYGGVLRKKPPLITKDNERAYFDSADWALEKQGAKVEKPPEGSEALLPKLQPNPQEQVRSRKSQYAPADDADGGNAAEDPASD